MSFVINKIGVILVNYFRFFRYGRPSQNKKKGERVIQGVPKQMIKVRRPLYRRFIRTKFSLLGTK